MSHIVANRHLLDVLWNDTTDNSCVACGVLISLIDMFTSAKDQQVIHCDNSDADEVCAYLEKNNYIKKMDDNHNYAMYPDSRSVLTSFGDKIAHKVDDCVADLEPDMDYQIIVTDNDVTVKYM